MIRTVTVTVTAGISHPLVTSRQKTHVFNDIIKKPDGYGHILWKYLWKYIGTCFENACAACGVWKYFGTLGAS